MILRKPRSEWKNPVRFLEKPNGDISLVVNMMALNDLVRKDVYSIQSIKDVLRAKYGSKWFPVVDLKDAFHSIEILGMYKHRTPFEVIGNVYEWNSMILGFKNPHRLCKR